MPTSITVVETKTRILEFSSANSAITLSRCFLSICPWQRPVCGKYLFNSSKRDCAAVISEISDSSTNGQTQNTFAPF